MSDFRGVFPYLVSPIDASGQIRTEVLGRLCDDLVNAGVHGLTPLGSTGEFAYLNNFQRARIVQTTVEAARGRVPVVAGVASTSTSDAVVQAKEYQKLGADGILAILEAYFPLQDAQVEAYFRTIADAVDIPVVIYTNPNLQRRLWRLNEAFARYNLAACIKAGLAIQGYEVGDPILPQTALSADDRKAVEAVLREIG